MQITGKSVPKINLKKRTNGKFTAFYPFYQIHKFLRLVFIFIRLCRRPDCWCPDLLGRTCRRFLCFGLRTGKTSHILVVVEVCAGKAPSRRKSQTRLTAHSTAKLRHKIIGCSTDANPTGKPWKYPSWAHSYVGTTHTTVATLEKFCEP